MRHRRFDSCSALLLLGVSIAPGMANAARIEWEASAAGFRVPSARTCTKANVRWTGASNRIYVTGNVTCTLTDIRKFAPPEAPLTLVDSAARTWLLGANLVLEQGATLLLDGTKRTGDVAELRLRSNNHAGADAFVELRAQWGNVMIRSTRITSWDESEGGPDTEYATFGRAFVRVVSYLDADGRTSRESRMDVIDSDIGYLGFYDAESYGLVWKVRDTTGPEVFDVVDVFGDIIDSKIHHNYFGMYSFGAYGMNITGNEVYSNVMYGVDPHDDSDALLVEDNNIHDNGNHGFICSKRCDGLIVRNNVSSSNAQTGFMLHRAVEDTLVEGNLAENNGDAGFAIMDSHENIFRGNIARGNKYGLRLSVGASDNLIEDNQLLESTLYGIYTYQGSDLPTINDGRPTRNRFARNDVSGSGELGLRAGEAHENTFVGNTFSESGSHAVFLDDATDNVFEANHLDGSYILSRGVSQNAIENTEFADVLIGTSTSSFTFTDSLHRVFLNNAGLSTEISAGGSMLTLTHADHAGLVGVDALPMDVTPKSGGFHVTVSAWKRDLRAWSTAPGSASTATFLVGDLAPGVRHDVWVDGVWDGSVVADRKGQLQIEHDVSEAHTFRIESLRRVRPIVFRPGR